MKRVLLFFCTLIGVYQLSAQTQLLDRLRQEPFNPEISKLRELSNIIPGERPTQINVEKIAETIRPASIVVKGEDSNSKMTLARTVYQIQYPNGTIMLDSGMDLETHNTFGKNEEPYFAEKFDLVKQALTNSNLIILTHYHADHIAGVIRSNNFEDLAKKTWVTESTANLLVNNPHKATTHISQEDVNKFIIVNDSKYMPIAPGVVLFTAPGHTPDSKMIYIHLADGREFIHSVDSGWSMDNIQKEKMKNASWVSENEVQLLQQYQWLNKIANENKDIVILCTHDNVQYDKYTKDGTLGNGLKID